MRPLRIGLIGAGGFGKQHLECIATMVGEGRALLSGVAEVSMEALTFARTVNADPFTQYYVEYTQMLEDLELDAVVVAVSIHLHYKIALDVVSRGIPLLLEKPPFPVIQQLQAVLESYPSARVAVFFQHICSWSVRRLKALLEGDRIGELHEIRVAASWPRTDSYYARNPWAGKLVYDGAPVFDGPVTNALSHLLHNAMFLAGAGSHFAVPVNLCGELYRTRRIEGYDLGALRATFADGVRIVACLGHVSRTPIPFVIDLRGKSGWLRVTEDGQLSCSDGLYELSPDEPKTAFFECYRDFLEACNFPGEWRPASSLQDTTGYVLTTHAAYLSSGGIHDISPKHAIWDESSDRGVFPVGIEEVMKACQEEGKLPSETGVPWAISGMDIALADTSNFLIF